VSESADAIIVAAGESRRMGGGRSKLLRPLGGKPLLAHTLAPFQQAEEIRRIAIVCRAEDREEVQALVQPYRIDKVSGFLPPGGAARSDSVYAGLSYLKANSAPDWVLVQDGARPFAEETLIRASLEAARITGAAVVATAVKDTVKEADAKDSSPGP
jgi:2-C-methyl-D-erythritol 4-phosphate cytidylyltransferase